MTPIVRSYPCLKSKERNCCAYLANAWGAGLPYVTRDSAWAYLTSEGTFTAMRRRIAFRDIYNITQTTVTIDDVDVVVWMLDQTWMVELYVALSAGTVSPAMPLCLQIAFYNAPEP